MTPTEVTTILRQFNEWRRGDYAPSEQPEPPNPYEVGLAIDAAVEMIERHFSQSFTDREWRAESATWAAAWKAAKNHGAQAQPAPSVQDVPAKSLKPVIDWLRNGCDPMRAADELDLLIAAAQEAKP